MENERETNKAHIDKEEDSNSFSSKYTYVNEIGGYYNIYKYPPTLEEAIAHRVF